KAEAKQVRDQCEERLLPIEDRYSELFRGLFSCNGPKDSPLLNPDRYISDVELGLLANEDLGLVRYLDVEHLPIYVPDTPIHKKGIKPHALEVIRTGKRLMMKTFWHVYAASSNH
ncbi:MAG TPA: hypothetical protein VFS42_11695, partial [Burkholderiaceae bacterium]|nr:hypothetical protein [Burkholderiaceae bacterium]